MTVNEYYDSILKNDIPTQPPDEIFYYENNYEKLITEDFQVFDQMRITRNECQERGLYFIISQDWLTKLSSWINKRKVLEIFSGAGWLAKGLFDNGNSIIATDDYSWYKGFTKRQFNLYPVKRYDAVTAVHKYKDESDILLISWAPLGIESIEAAAREWGNEKPIILIGEGPGGCTATDEFMTNFETLKIDHGIKLPKWPWIDDYLDIGIYKG